VQRVQALVLCRDNYIALMPLTSSLCAWRV